MKASIPEAAGFLFSTPLMVDGQKYEIKSFKRISFCSASIGTGRRCVKEKVNQQVLFFLLDSSVLFGVAEWVFGVLIALSFALNFFLEVLKHD